MKILFLIPTLKDGGAERAMSNITTHLPEGVSADILINSLSDRDFPTDAKIINLGMAESKTMGIVYQFIAMIKRTHKLYKLKRHNNYDACISFMDSVNISNILTGNKYCKTITSVRVSLTQESSLMYRYIVVPMVKLLYNKADYVVAVSKGVRTELIETFKLLPDKVKTITNGYDVKAIREKAKLPITESIFDFWKGKFIYVTMGRFTAQKAQWHLIRAFSRVSSECSDARLIIIGQGEEEAYFQELIKKNSLQDKVHLHPYQKNPFTILNKCDVFVIPSMFEGYCNALCEALICGLPCIATDFQTSAREILAPDTDYEYRIQEGVEYASYGILTPVCSGVKYNENEPLERAEQYLAEAMISLYQDNDLLVKYREKASARGQQMDIEQKVREWLELVR